MEWDKDFIGVWNAQHCLHLNAGTYYTECATSLVEGAVSPECATVWVDGAILGVYQACKCIIHYASSTPLILFLSRIAKSVVNSVIIKCHDKDCTDMGTQKVWYYSHIEGAARCVEDAASSKDSAIVCVNKILVLILVSVTSKIMVLIMQDWDKDHMRLSRIAQIL